MNEDFIQHLRSMPPDVFLASVPLLCGGEREIALALFIIHAGLTDCAPDDASATGALLRERLAGADPDVAVEYVARLARMVHLPPADRGALTVEAYEDIVRQGTGAALAAMEGFASIRAEDYPRTPSVAKEKQAEEVDRLGPKLRECLRAVSPDMALQFLGLLAGLCSQNRTRGARAAVAVIESFFQMSAGAYTPVKLTSCLGQWFAMQPGIGFCGLLVVWGPYLCGMGRGGEARSFFRWVFHWEDKDLGDGSRLADRVRTRLEGVPPDLSLPVWTAVPTVMHPVLPRLEVLRFIETWLKIDAWDYLHPAVLLRRLGWDRNEDPEIPETAMTRAIGLLQALANAHQPTQAFDVLWSLVHRRGERRPDITELIDRFYAFGAALPGHHRSAFHQRVAHTLFSLQLRPQTILYLERLFGLELAGYTGSPGDLAARLRFTTAGFSPEEPILLVSQLAWSLAEEEGREQHTQKLLDVYLWRVLDLEAIPLVNGAAVVPICMMIELWLDRTDPGDSYPRCGQILAFLRRCLDVRGFHFEDRERFLHEIGTLRQRIVQVGYDQAGRDGARVCEVLRWDVELGQRILFERYRFHRPSSLDAPGEGGAPAGVMEQRWSLNEPPSDVDDYLPADEAMETTSGRFGMEGHAANKTEASCPDLSDAPDGRCQAAERIVREGTTVEQLAAALGDNALLLRAGFTADGRLVWNAFRSDGRTLTCIAGRTDSDRSAIQDITSAVAWHDWVLDALWSEQGKAQQPLSHLCRILRPYAEDILNRLGTRRGSRFDPNALQRAAATLLHECEEAGDVGKRLSSWFRAVTPADWLEIGNQRAPWLSAWTGVTQTLRGLSEGLHEGRLDAATAEFLRWVARRWDLTPLAEHLHPDLDLVVEVEEALHAVPAAFLLVPSSDGEPARLFDRVRSVRSSLSLLLGLLQGTEPPQSDGGAGTLLTVSWFAENDPARRGAWWLHHGQRLLARRYGRSWASAGDDPAGRSAVIARTVASNPAVRLLAVCGHGRAGGPGVCLGDGNVWAGEGCDLRRVDWLLSVSCSIGRLAQQPAVPDVEGFTAALLARHARAALACRWPVHALQAAWFANAVAHEYLDPSKLTGRSDRAGALARVRKKFFGNTLRGRGTIGLNTLAAFDLYGEG